MSAALLVMSLAAVSAVAPDLFLVEGRDWRVVLPVSALAGGGDAVTPVILAEPENTKWIGVFLERYAPRSVATVSTTSKAALADVVATHAPETTLLKYSAPAARMGLLLAQERFPVGAGNPPVVLVADDALGTALLATVLAGSQRGVLLVVDEESMPAAFAFAAARESAITWAGPGPDAALSHARRTGVEIEVLSTVRAIEDRTHQALLARRSKGAAPHVVFTNPEDTRGFFSPPHLSILAPLYALSKHADLLVTGARPDAIEASLADFEARHGTVTHLTLVGDHLALGMREMLDPDEVWRKKKQPRRFKVPLFGGLTKLAPAEYAVGRLAAEDVYGLSLQIGRIVTPARFSSGENRRSIMLSNADLKFIMAELISKATVRELRNAGVPIDAYYGTAVDRRLIREQLPDKQLIIWEGHPRDLANDYEIGIVNQKLDASLVFLQGCYTLDRSDPYLLVQQGVSAVIGTYMAVYSASGSAFAKAFFDALIYEGEDQGTALLHARNFLLAYVELKKRRGHQQWRKTWRAGLSFDLWGDPTARPVRPARPSDEPLRLERRGDQVVFRLAPVSEKPLRAGRYTARLTPGAQLGAIYTRKPKTWGDERRMQEVYFGWVDLPDFEQAPELTTAIPERDWAMVWSPLRRRLYLLVHNDAAEQLGRAGLHFELGR